MTNDEIQELEGMIATLELENKLMRARNERLEKEVEELKTGCLPKDYVFVCKKCGDEIGLKYETT